MLYVWWIGGGNLYVKIFNFLCGLKWCEVFFFFFDGLDYMVSLLGFEGEGEVYEFY